MFEELLAREAPRGFVVYPENHATVRLFLDVSTQWRTSMSGIVGLDYGAVATTADLLGHEVTPDVFHGLQLMERAVLHHLAEGRSQ